MYFPENDENIDSILAGLETGSLRAWRVDADGRQWFTTTMPPIHGVADESGEPEYEAEGDEQYADEPAFCVHCGQPLPPVEGDL